ncbi:MAG: PAS domain S-box protein, partial [Anaerolineae bacterium]
GGDRFESRHRRKDGAILDVEISIRPSPMDDRLAVAFLRDITARKRADSVLRQSEEHYRTILQTAMDGFLLVDPQGCIVDVNDAYCQMSGYSREELLSMRVADIEIVESADMVAARIQDLRLSGGNRFESQHRRKDGSPLDLDIALRYTPLEGGRVVGFFRDITEHNKADQALRRSDERHRAIMETALDGILLVDARTQLLEANDAYCRMSGYTREELLSMRIPELHPADETAAVVVQLREIMQRGWGRFECRHLRKDGSTFQTELGVRYTPEDGGRAVIFVRDITDRKQAEADREQLDEQLRQSQKMQAVGQLAGGVAHDLNNMLGVINGYSEMILQGLAQSSPLYADIGEIKKAGDRSAQLTRQLLAFARRQAIAPKVLDLNVALEGMFSMLRRLVGENIALVWKPGASVWPVKIDPGQMDQILANLVVNARDAIAGVGTVSIATENAELDEYYCRTHVGSEPGQYVAIVVSDDGCGMGKEVLEHIYEPFFTTKPVGQGTGLGLATVYGITKQNGGNIHVYSEPGQGTAFRIYLPRYVAQGEVIALDADLADVPTGTETVLVVEDEVALLELSRRVLEQLGYTVLSADTPHEALRLAEVHKGHIDLLLTDVVMPGMGGRQLQEILRSAYPEVKYLFVSGYAAGALNQQGVLETDTHLLQKPFTRSQLARRVRAALDER